MATWDYGTTGASSTDVIWHSWTMASAGTSDGGTIWRSWTDDCTSTATSSGSDTVWAAWTSADAGSARSVDYSIGGYRQPARVQETEEEKQARLELQEQREAARQVALRAKEEAARKAKELLKESLDAEQLDQLERTNWFFVKSQLGKRYRIRHRWAGNVDEIDDQDRVVAEYCIHPRQRVPVEDSMLIQKLMLEADEPRFLQIANRMGYSVPRPMVAH